MKPQMKLTKEIEPDKFWGHVDKTKDCWVWTGTITRGYGKYKGFQAHRVSWLIHHGKDPHGFYALHTCDNRACVNPDHLYLGTQSDNMKDMYSRRRRINNTAIAKYSWKIVNEIRELYKTGEYSLASLGRRFGMNRSMVYKILNYHIWKTE
jgi:hypothetical protein